MKLPNVILLSLLIVFLFSGLYLKSQERVVQKNPVVYSANYEDCDFEPHNILRLINDYRRSKNKSELQWNSKLEDSSSKKAIDLYEKGYWAHTSPTGLTPWDIIRSTGYTYQYAGENLAKGFSDGCLVLTAWKNSRTHNEVLLGERYQEAGISIFQDYVVLHVGALGYKLY